MNIKSIDPTTIPQPDLYGFLSSAVAPRPICFASTIDAKGNVNLSPFSFFNVFSINPPIMIFSPVRSGRDNSTKHTYDNVLEVKETAINIVNHPIVEQMSLASTAYAKGVNEFTKAGLTPIASEKVRPPRVKEAPISFECVVDNVIELGDGPGAGNLIIARVVMIHVQEQYLDADGKLDTIKLDLVARLGGNWYSRAIKECLFEVPKPIRNQGIGIDQLPESIRNSDVLTGNNLGRLGNMEKLPTQEEIVSIKERADVKKTLEQYASQPKEMKLALHRIAKDLLESGKTQEAIKVLMVNIRQTFT